LLITIPPPNTTQCHNIYFITLPDEQRKPYSINATRQFNKVDDVKQSIHSFKMDKLNVIQGIIAQYGNGVNEGQLAAISR